MIKWSIPRNEMLAFFFVCRKTDITVILFAQTVEFIAEN